MPFIFKKPQVIEKPVEQPKKPTMTMAQLKAAAAPSTPISQSPKTVESKEQDVSGVIKPKYLEDKSVFYKTSGYLKDLLGEGN